MNLVTPKSAIVAFAPIGFMDEPLKRKACSDKLHQSSLSVPGRVRVTESVQKNDLSVTKNDEIKLNKSVKKSANVCFGGFFNANKIYSSGLLKKSLGFAADNGALFLAAVAFVTGAVLRPLAIFATPGVKKGNKEYASANSISSSVIGLGLMALASTPIAHAVKKINANPEKYLSKATIKNLTNDKTLLSSSKYKFATQLFKIGSDFVCAVPKALLTCALIPPIISALFPRKDDAKKIVYPASAVSFNSLSQYNRSKQIFKGFIKEGSYEG